MRDPRTRLLRLEEEIARILSEAVAGLLHEQPPDERLRGITITRVELTGDKKRATVYFSTVISGMDTKEALDLLHEHKGWLRSAVAHTLRSIKAPVLQFVPDDEIERSARLSELFERIKSEGGSG